ncbi:MAG: S53 family peptidase [Propionibacteriaceae bacterium]|nr:S8/S53 family peptidase [Micropruina sp.]
MPKVTPTVLATASVAALIVVCGSNASAAPGGSRHVVSPAAAWTSKVAQATPDGDPVRVKLWLTPRDQTGLKALATAVSTPGDAAYRQFLTVDQYQARFAPTSAQVDAVKAWLASAGLTVEAVGPGNYYVAASGPAAKVSDAFTANLKKVTVNGHTGNAPTTTVTVPDSVGTAVLAVTGLNTVTQRAEPATSGTERDTASAASKNAPKATLDPPAAFVNATPCSDYYGQLVDTTDPTFQGSALPYAVCGYVPRQFREAYGVRATGRTGLDQTIAIVDAFASPTILQDANTYASAHGDAPFASWQFSESNDTNYIPSRVNDCGGNGWFGEETLDVEAAHGMAPDASVAYYGAASCYDDDMMATLARVVTDNKASVVSNSWGEPTYVVIGGVTYTTIDQALVDAYEAIFQQGAVQGIGFFFSSGDNGDEVANTGVKSPDFPAADPWVTAVGGTSLALDRAGRIIFETGWGTEMYSLAGSQWSPVGFLYGAGGGCSDVFVKPAYQMAVNTHCNMRAVPDVAMDGDPTTGMRIGQTQTFADASVWGPAGVHYGEFRIGGTSLAAPLFAGMQADAQPRHGRIGFGNPTVYRLAALKRIYRDTVAQGDKGNVRVDYVNWLNASAGFRTSVQTFNQDSSLATRMGWDNVTGVGSPTAWYLLNAGLGTGAANR